MNPPRHCSKSGCTIAAVATLTYDYADSMMVLGPLSRHVEPFTYDLCQTHAERLTPPQGWQVVRLHTRYDEVPLPADDPEALIMSLQQPLSREHQDTLSHRSAPVQASADALGDDVLAMLTEDAPREQEPDGETPGASPASAPAKPSAAEEANYSATIIELPLHRTNADKATTGRTDTRAPHTQEHASNVEFGPFGAPTDGE